MKERDDKWSTASLMIFSREITEKEIAAELGLKATRIHDKGDLISPHHTSVRREWAWLLQSPLGRDRSLTDHLKWILDAIEPKLGALQALMDVCRIDLFCGFASENGQGGFTLDADTLKRLARLGVSLTLDLYPPESLED